MKQETCPQWTRRRKGRHQEPVTCWFGWLSLRKCQLSVPQLPPVRENVFLVLLAAWFWECLHGCFDPASVSCTDLSAKPAVEQLLRGQSQGSDSNSVPNTTLSPSYKRDFFLFLQTGQMDKSKNWEALHFRLRFLMLLNKTTTFFTSTSTDVVVLYYLGKNTFMIRRMDPLAPVTETETLRNTCNT